MKRFFISALMLLLFVQGASAQINEAKVKAELCDKKWTIAVFEHHRGMSIDTIFSAYDCNNDNFVMKTDGTYLSSKFPDKPMSWEIQNDSIMMIYKGKSVYKERTITEMADGRFTMRYYDKKSNGYLYEKYLECKEGAEANVNDSRVEIVEQHSDNLIIGIEQFGSGYATLGYSHAIYKENHQEILVGGDLKFNVHQSTYGAGIYAKVLQPITMFGIEAATYTNFDKTIFGLKPLFGFHGRKLGTFAENLMLYTSFNFVMSSNDFPAYTYNKWSINLKYKITLKSKEKKKYKVNPNQYIRKVYFED